jgi:N-acetylneuraminate lyase
MVDRLIGEGVAGLYVAGTTGEGPSLTTPERQQVTEATVAAAAGRVPVVVHVGHNSVEEARRLATHAAQCGADVLSATPPSYFPVDSIEALIACMAHIAAVAPQLPFYYYHIPRLTGAALDMVAFLERGGDRIPNLAGIKFTAPTLDQYQACLDAGQGRFDVLWGLDEMLLPAMALGARGAVGSTYNIAAPLYRGLIDALAAGEMCEARRRQRLAVEMIHTILRWPFLPAMKEVLRMLDMDCGPCRLPHLPIGPEDVAALRESLERIGFFEFRVR